LYKGETTFLEPHFFEMAIYDINGALSNLCHVRNATTREYAEVLDRLNNLHPFREENGRAARLFLQIFAANNGDYLSYSRHDSEMIQTLSEADIDKIASMLALSKIESLKKAYDEVAMQRLNEIQNQSQIVDEEADNNHFHGRSR
jgi:cell filamentation protein